MSRTVKEVSAQSLLDVLVRAVKSIHSNNLTESVDARLGIILKKAESGSEVIVVSERDRVTRAAAEVISRTFAPTDNRLEELTFSRRKIDGCVLFFATSSLSKNFSGEWEIDGDGLGNTKVGNCDDGIVFIFQR